jgi:membrane fusion protein (multidrug efflux system)
LLALVVGGFFGVRYWLDARQYEATDDAFIDGDMVAVSAQIAGRLSAVHVTDNQDVAAGDIIAEIEPIDFATRVQQAEATLAAARARLQVAQTAVDLTRANSEATMTQARAGVGLAEAAVKAAQSAVESARADVAAAQAEAGRREADVKRYEAIDVRAVSQQQRDAARASADAATAQLSAAQKRAAAAEAQVAEAQAHVSQAQGVLQAAQTAPQQVASAEAQVKTAEAAVREGQAQVQAAQQQLGYTRIVAPVAGRITRKSAQPGQYVEAGQGLCMVVSPNVWVTANFKETQLTHMHGGQVVEIRVDAYPDRVFHGRVASIQAGTGSRFSLMPPENATGNFVKVVQRVPVKIVFEESPAAQRLLGPGMSAVPRVRVAGDEGEPSPIAPAPRSTSARQ